MNRRLAASLLGSVLSLTVVARASSPRFFQAATQGDFLKGDVENLSIDSRNQLSLAPATELVYEAASPFLWALAPAADGTLYLGAGNDGKVFRIDPQGAARTLFTAPELEVHALALAPDGSLYVGTSPNGKIYKIDRAGAASTFFEPQEKYIWALAVDTKGTVYAATGDKGVIYKIGPDGKGAPFYRTKATHVTALAFDRAGALLAGTESPGRVLRIDADAKGFVLLDSPYQEVRALRVDPSGAIYVAALNGRAAEGAAPAVDDRPADGPRAPVASVSTEISAVSVVVDSAVAAAPSTPAASSSPAGRGQKGAVYRIAPDGLWDEVWSSRDDSPYDLAVEADGRLMVATGGKGKLYRLEGNPLRATLIARANAQQITALHRDPRGRLVYATANPGKVMRLSSAFAPEGTYESEPRDAQMVASWGTISWRGTTPPGTRIDLVSRSGNTETPDDTWSPWSAAYASADGSAITSPKARYLQWRATLSGKGQSPTLTSVTAAYLQRNARPEVRSITVHPPGIVFQKPFSSGDPDLAGFESQTTPERRLSAQASLGTATAASPALGKRAYQRGLQTLVWRADDANEDELTYEVQYRREGEAAWKTLRRDFTDSILVWDTTTVPNGTYFVRVIASDRASNSTTTTLSGELDSAAFEIDNTPPVFSQPAVRVDGARTIISIDVRDDHSPIQRLEFSVDGEQWTPAFPADGIADVSAVLPR